MHQNSSFKHTRNRSLIGWNAEAEATPTVIHLSHQKRPFILQTKPKGFQNALLMKAERLEIALRNLPIIGSTNNPLVVEPDASDQFFMAF